MNSTFYEFINYGIEIAFLESIINLKIVKILAQKTRLWLSPEGCIYLKWSKLNSK